MNLIIKKRVKCRENHHFQDLLIKLNLI